MENQDNLTEEEIKSLQAIAKIVKDNPELYKDMYNIIKETHKKITEKEKTKEIKP